MPILEPPYHADASRYMKTLWESEVWYILFLIMARINLDRDVLLSCLIAFTFVAKTGDTCSSTTPSPGRPDSVLC